MGEGQVAKALYSRRMKVLTMKKAQLIAIVAITAIFFIASAGTAQAGYTATQLTSNYYGDDAPAINGNGYVVWSGSDGSDYEIYLYTPGYGISKLTNNNYPDEYPDINSSGKIAWVANDGTGYKVYQYTPGYGAALIHTSSNNITDTAISDNGWIVWQGLVSWQWEIYVYWPGISPTLLTNNSTNDISPEIDVAQFSGSNIVVWQGHDGNDYEIYSFVQGGGGGNIAITSNSADDLNPDVNNSAQVVWEGYTGADYEIFLKSPGGSPLQLSGSGVSNDSRPAINNSGQVAWHGYDGNDFELYLYDGGHGTSLVTSNSYHDFDPAINAGGRMAWHGSDGSDNEIFLAWPNPATNPFGSLDGAATDYSGQISLSGWAIDPDGPGPISVHVYVNGKWGGSFNANVNRPDVGNAFRTYGPNHGFSGTVWANAPSNTVCAYGINTGTGGNALLGCKTVYVAVYPFGSLDKVTANYSGYLTLKGWAIEPNTLFPIDVHAYVNGQWGDAFNAAEGRPDVGAAFPFYGPNHGFTWSVWAKAQSNTVCAYGINTGPGNNVLLGCKTVNVAVYPFGNLESVTVGGPGLLNVKGWAIDPNNLGAIEVHFWVNGNYGGQLGAGGSRPDVGAIYPFYGANHGFSGTVAGNPGSTVCAYGINTGPGDNALLGCRKI